MPKTLVLVAPLLLLAAAAAVVDAQEPKTRDELVRDDLANFGSADGWIYNDLERGFEAARAENKPLLVVFRCIPCHACAQLDASIVERDARVQKLLDQYVCVRVVHANGMDLALFQFDYDQSFAAFLMNGDRTIYGRYGTRSHQTRSEDDVSLEGFAEALEAGLEIHAAYPENKSSLSGKQPRVEPAYEVPEQYPSLERYSAKLDYDGKVAASCIHCHQVGEALRSVLRDAGQPVPTEVLFPYPHPKILGLAMDPQRRATVERVEPGSAADRAGLEAGDELESVDGQSIVSTADIQWALHQLTDDEAVAIAARRDGEPLEASLALEPGWRARGDISWRATSWALRRMVAGGLKLDELPREERAARQLADDALALEVAHVGQYGEHAHAKRQGFREGDVIVAIDGRDRAMRESDLFAALVNKPVGERVSVDVLRGSEKLELNLVMQK